MSLLRFASSQILSTSGAGSQLLTRAIPASAAFIPKKTFVVSPSNRKRLYGPVPDAEKEDDLQHWKKERIVAISLLPIIPAAMAFPHPVLDTFLTVGICLHTHWRLSGVAEDYVHGEVLPRIAQPLLLILSICAFGSLSYLNYYDVGFANAARLLFSQL